MIENTNGDQEMRLLAIRGRGASDFHANRTVFNCPYSVGTAEYNEYERGWTQALKRTPVASFERFGSDWEPAPEPKPYEPPKVNEYARRKG